jgi:hypothetical protein
MRADGFSRRDWIPAAVLWGATFLVFGAGAARLGFYYDDGGWMTGLPDANPSRLWEITRSYVPGRNLHVVWQYLIYKLAGGRPAAHLPALHLIQSAMDGLVAACFFLLLRLLDLTVPAALMAAGLFSFWPAHGETHYWLPAAPQNLLSTLFVLAFAWTSLRSSRRRWWFWLIDAPAFACALYTYDQVFFLLCGIAALRVSTAIFRNWEAKWRFAAAHLIYLAAMAHYVWLKLRILPGSAPELSSGAWERLRFNILATASSTLGPAWLRQAALLYEKATFADWLLCLLAAAMITGLAMRFLSAGTQGAAPPRRPSLLLLLAAGFYAASYLPIWLWHISERHHYLPSLGLFAAGAACLAEVLHKISSRLVHSLIFLALGASACAFAAAGRGESRYWEESFAAKRQLFAEIRDDLRGKQALALEGFPLNFGPAYLLAPHDAQFGPQLFYGPSFPLGPDFSADISSAPAPRGLFFRTLVSLYGFENFRYIPTSRALVVRFSGWEAGRLRYEKNPADPAPYEILSMTIAPQAGTFAVSHFTARREPDAIVLSIAINAHLPPDSYLAALPAAFHHGEFHRWGRIERNRGLNLAPVLLSREPLAGGYSFREELRLYGVPAASRMQLEFFAAGRDRPPVALGRCETSMEQ